MSDLPIISVSIRCSDYNETLTNFISVIKIAEKDMYCIVSYSLCFILESGYKLMF